MIGGAPRDRSVDVLRAVAILGVVLGHWLVSAVVSDPDDSAAWHGVSSLVDRPELIPASWFLQTLGLFFFAGGFASARSGRPPGARLARLVRPVAALTAVWVPALWLLQVSGVPASTRHVIWSLLVHPLWFLLVYGILTVLAPLFRRPWALLPLITAVVVSDVWRHQHAPTWLAVVVTPIGWAVPYTLGMQLAEGRIGRKGGLALLSGGILAGVMLVLVAGYPASAVGVPGDGWSNLDPPSLFAMALAAAQIGVFLLLRPRLTVRPRAVAALNRLAMPVYLWHQSALLLVTFAGHFAGALPGLLDPPTGSWLAHRLLWLPAFALVLAALCFRPSRGR